MYKMLFEEVEPEQCIVHLDWDIQKLSVKVDDLDVVPPYDLDLNAHSEVIVVYSALGLDSFQGRYYDSTTQTESYMGYLPLDHRLIIAGCEEIGGHNITLLTQNSPIPQ